MTHEDRIAAAQAALSNRDEDGLILYCGPNSFYLSGFFGEPNDRHALFIVPREGRPWFCATEKSTGQIRSDTPLGDCRVVERPNAVAIADRAVDAFDEDASVLLEDRTPFSLAEPFVESGLTVGSATLLLEELRLRKDGDEIDALRGAGALADEVSEDIRSLGEAAIGMTEAEIAARIRSRLHGGGASRVSFPVVVATGPNAAQPYYRHGDRTIQRGDPVVLDFGAVLDGYASDQTRTVVFAGTPPEDFVDAHEAVREAFKAGVEAVEPGRSAGEIDRVVRSTVADHGFEEALRHDTGHGVGVESHEAPSIATGNDRTLEPGMVFSVEPGVYLPDRFGVRLEDLVVVTESGCERINRSPKTWRASGSD